ncbi:MAG: hypothetical protein RL019_1906 [Pseudomonadota bacterium]
MSAELLAACACVDDTNKTTNNETQPFTPDEKIFPIIWGRHFVLFTSVFSNPISTVL